jgi:hypothetical protein
MFAGRLLAVFRHLDALGKVDGPDHRLAVFHKALNIDAEPKGTVAAELHQEVRREETEAART